MTYQHYKDTYWWIENGYYDCLMVKVVAVDGDKATIEYLPLMKTATPAYNSFVPTVGSLGKRMDFRFAQLLPHLPLTLLGARTRRGRKEVPWKSWNGEPLTAHPDGYELGAKTPWHQ